MPRIGVDATSVSRDGKGHARSQRRLVEALAALGRYDVVAYVRTQEAAALLPGVETSRDRAGKAVAWEQVGMRRALRRLDALVTLGDRLPLGAEERASSSGSSSSRRTGSRRTGAAAWARTSAAATCSRRRSGAGASRARRRVVAGSRATAAELGGDVPVVYPAVDDGLRPRPRSRRGGTSSTSRRPTRATTPRPCSRPSRGSRPTSSCSSPAASATATRSCARSRASGSASSAACPTRSSSTLYRGALAYVDATLYEGFGYQLVEALACGAPVVASSRSSIPEVVGDAGLLCDPRRRRGDRGGAASRALRGRARRATCARRGFEQARPRSPGSGPPRASPPSSTTCSRDRVPAPGRRLGRGRALPRAAAARGSDEPAVVIHPETDAFAPLAGLAELRPYDPDRSAPGAARAPRPRAAGAAPAARPRRRRLAARVRRGARSRGCRGSSSRTTRRSSRGSDNARRPSAVARSAG